MISTEILAPAGSLEALKAALRTGANAVYVGGRRFSARNSQAAGLDSEELKKASHLCHMYGAKLYIAVNTVITDEEAGEFCNFIKFLFTTSAKCEKMKQVGKIGFYTKRRKNRR